MTEKISTIKEQKLLLDCLGQETAGLFGELQRLSIADWNSLVREAQYHNVAPLLYSRLKSLACATELPTNILSSLREQYLGSAARNLRLYHQLSRILNALCSEDIPVIALKGAFLAQVVYRNPALRPMEDIDLLVKKTDLVRAEACLLKLGYAPDEKNRTKFAEFCSHNGYLLPNSDVFVEIHWHIEGSPSPFSIDVGELWERTQPCTIAGVPVFVLSPEDLLLHLCIHTSFHHLFNANGLRSLCDIALTLEHYRNCLDWNAILLRSRAWRASNAIYLTLLLSMRLFGAQVNSQVFADLGPTGLNPEFISWAENRLFRRIDTVSEIKSDNWGRLHASKRIPDKIRLLWQTCIPARDELVRRYSISPGITETLRAYPKHWQALLSRHGPRAWKLSQGDAATRVWLEWEAARVEEMEIKKQVLMQSDRKTMTWIKQDPARLAQLAVVTWLASS